MAAPALTSQPDIIWRPYPGAQDSFMRCPAREVLLHGTRGGGKSDCLLMAFAQHVGTGLGAAWRGVIFRRTFPQLSDLVARAQRWFPRIFPDARFNASKYEWTFADGEVLQFGYMRREADYENYHGKEFGFIGWDELTNFPTMTAYEKMMSCLRSSVKGVPLKVRSTCNPAGPGHNAVKRHFKLDQVPDRTVFQVEGSSRCTIFSSLEENLAQMEHDPEYIDRLDSLKETNPPLYEAWRLGSWDVVAGGAFDDVWRRDRHYIEPFRLPPTWTVDRAFDWGSSAPFSVLWFAESDGSEFDIKTGLAPVSSTAQEDRRWYPRGSLFVIAEWYGANDRGEGLRLTNRKIAEGIVDRELRWEDAVAPGPADSSIFDRVNDTSIAEEMERYGIAWDRADKSPGSRINGMQVVRTMLLNAADSYRLEHPGLFLFQPSREFPGWGCPGLASRLPVLARDEKYIEDVDTTQEDHDYDALRYRVLASGRGKMAMQVF